MKKILTLISLVLILGLLGCSLQNNGSQSNDLPGENVISSPALFNDSPSSTPKPPSGYKWVKVDALSDEFNGSGINSSKWYDYHPFWSGRHPSAFKKGNAFVKNGYLQLRSTSRVNQAPANPTSKVWIDAAAVVSKQKIAQPGWYYETSFRASNCAMSSSFWFRVGRFSEIDVIEHIGHATKSAYIANKKSYLYESNSHVYGTQSGKSVKAETKMATRGRDQFHTYGFWWKDTKTLIFYLNGNETHRITPSVAFTEKLHMIFDTETLASNYVGYPTVASLKDNSKNTMYVDWVRTYKLVKDGSSNPGRDKVCFKNLASSIKAGKNFTVSVEYEAKVKRDIIVQLKDPNNKWLGNGKKTVQQGTGIVYVTVNLAQTPPAGANYSIQCDIRPVGSGWQQIIKSEIKKISIHH